MSFEDQVNKKKKQEKKNKEKEKQSQKGSYNKIRYYLVTENVFIVLAFLLIAVGVLNLVYTGLGYLVTYIYLIAGVVLLGVGITIAYKMIVAFSRKDVPIYNNLMTSTDVDPEIGLYYYDVFLEKADSHLQLALSSCYLASFQLEGIEHLRHFVGYQRSADTMAEIGEIFKSLEAKMGDRKIVSGCKSGHEIVLLVCDIDLDMVKNIFDDVVNDIRKVLSKLATTESFNVYCGYSSFPKHASDIDTMISNTNFSLYEATLFHKTEPHLFSPDAFRRQETEYVRDNKIRHLLDDNALTYNFQPIVSAKTGKIYAYEALMRTPKDIGLGPEDVLELAERQDRLYEVEHYTFFNVLKIMNDHRDNFEERKLFINSIPTVIIKEHEFDDLMEKYKGVMKNMVIEITENGMQSEESCEAVHKYMDKSGCELALDDYGTGYSNASTLLNNSPHYLKIDHSMIMGIDSDSKKQHLVANYISFANNHNMKILAEGVETPEELQMVIQLGCHLIQGFYTGRPNREIIDRINEDIENEIIAINLKLAQQAEENKVYEMGSYENISLVNLALDFYSGILVKGTANKIQGDKNKEVSLSIKIDDNTESLLSIRDINIRGREKPSIEIGENSKLVLCVEGDNYMSYEGIRVPKSSKLIVQGNGNLTIRVDHNNGVGIGCALPDSPYGSILFEQTGKVRVETNGDIAVGIGGIVADDESFLKFATGDYEVIANGSKSIGIGALGGPTKIIIDNCHIALSASGADAVGIGSFFGNVDISSIGDIEMDVSGSNSTGIGTLKDNEGKILINSGLVNIILHCMEGVAIGSMNGMVDTYVFGDEIFVFAEGSDVGGIGDYRGSGNTYIRSGTVKITLLAAMPIALGGTKGMLEISGGNVLCDLTNSLQPVNQFGTPVYHREVASDEPYTMKIETEEGAYIYQANPTELFDNIHIYLPKFCTEQELVK